MLTLKSKFSEFIDLCRKNGACSSEGDAIPWMEGVAKSGVGIFGDALNIYAKDEKIPEVWNEWVLNIIGKELDEKVRKIFISKIKEPMVAFQLYKNCCFLTDEEDKLLEAKFIKDGKHLLPTAEKELATGIVTRAKVSK